MSTTPSSITPPEPTLPTASGSPGKRSSRPLPQPTVNQRSLQRSEEVRSKRVVDLMEERPGQGTDDSVVFRIGRYPIHYGPLLILILIATAITRFAGLDWGGSYYLHPDERFVVMVTTGIQWPAAGTYFDSAVSTLNPYNNNFGGFLYGTFPVFAAKLLGTITGDNVYGNMHIPGRMLSAFYDMGTVALAAWAARKLYGKLASIFTATFLAFTALLIQTAHYYTTDSAVVVATTGVIACTVMVSKSRNAAWYIPAGIFLGVAMASKPNAAATVGFLAIPLLEHIRLNGWLSIAPRFSRRSDAFTVTNGRRSLPGFGLLVGAVIAGILALLTFRVLQPYAFTGPHFWNFSLDPRWTDSLSYWSQAQAGVIDYPPGFQWANRTPIVFMVKNMVLWGMAPGFGIIALLAIGYAVVRCLLSWHWPSWWTLGLAGWSWFHILYYGTNHVPSQRYMLPAYPAMAILGGAFLASLIAWARSGRPLRLGSTLSITLSKRWPKVLHPGYLIPFVSIGITIFYGVAFTNIFIKPLTRVEASEWIYENVPAGSAVTGEYWDDGLPLCIPNENCQQYTGIELYPYAEDDVNKLTTLIGGLDRTDYVILSSRRLIDSIAQMPYRWPMTTAYYDYLFDGSLGFELVAQFSSPPSIGPIAIDDSSAEESLTVYEHPQVYIFKKTDAWNAKTAYDRLYATLQTGLGDDTGLVIPSRADSPDLQLMDRSDQRAYYAEGTWREMFDVSSWTNRFPALSWYLAIQLLTLPMIPILWRLFPGLPDRGYALAKTGGLIATGYLAWLMASVRLVQWGPIPILIAWGALWVLAFLCLRGRGAAFRTSLGERRAWFVAAEIIFLAGFAIAVWIRMQNPNLWNPWTGGEKPMDLAYFNATIRTPFFPPYDPWFRNGTIHYYYWGLVPWAMLTRLTGIIPTTAYNLAVPGVFALFLLNTWTVAATFLQHLVPARPGFAHTRRFTGRIRIMLLALIAPIITGILGNLQLIRLIGLGIWEGTKPVPASWPQWGALTDMIWGAWQIVSRTVTLPVTSSYWDPTRVIPGTINEFPYFSFIFGDLHPHFTTLPLLTATIGVIAAFVFSIKPKVAPGLWKPASIFTTLGGWKPALTMALIGGLLGGMLMASNSWDFPPAMALLCAAGFILIGTASGWTSGWTLLRDVGAFVAIAVVSSQVFWLPYIKHYGSLPSSFEATTDSTTMPDFLSINGVLLFVVASYLALEIVRIVRPQLNRGGAAAAGATIGLGIGAVCFLLAFMSGKIVLLLALMLAVVVLIAWVRQFERGHLLLLAMIGLGVTLLLLPDVLRLQNDIGRMNTVFKFYFHAWVVLGIAGSVGLGLVFDAFQRRSLADAPAPAPIPVAPLETGAEKTRIIVLAQTPTERGWKLSGRTTQIAWTILLVLLVAGAAAYPAIATVGRARDVITPIAPTLDGMAYMDVTSVTYGPDGGQPTTFSLVGDREAIEWLNKHTNGLPTILEAYDGEYAYGNRISAMTGLPTVIGWSAQERVQRPGLEPLIQNRIDDVNEIYGSYSDFASVRPLLDRYGVQIIYIGGLERALYSEAALSKFNEGVEDGALKTVYDRDGVQIYVYDRSVPVPSDDDAVPEGIPGTPAASPEASPVASPEASPAVEVVASPVSSPVAVEGSPAATPGTPATTKTPEPTPTTPPATRTGTTPTPTMTPVG
ncbi:MAG: DUF2298 domain-containing protein [Thermomicrobiales bacterium]